MENSVEPVKLLIIEDDEDDYIIIKELLGDIYTQDYIITWINEYEKALKLLNENEHDICILDYRLGAHDGIEILKEIFDWNIDIPVVLLTGQGEYKIDVRAMEAGAADYIVKDNLSSEVLERSIRYTLDRAQTDRELRSARGKLEEKVQERTSELIHVNNALKKASEKLEFFAYSISHDLKSPATSLFSLTNRLRNNFGEKLGGKGMVYCDQILAASRQIISLVENLNLFISEKEMPLNVKEIRLKELLEEIRLEFSKKINSRKIDWETSVNSPLIRADRLSIIRVLRNLVENAFKYGGENLSYIGITFEETTEAYIIRVIDDGQGLADSGDDVFLPFRRTGITKNIEGTGLGLSIVKEIAQKHGGDVWTEQDTGKGATFCFSISKHL